MSIMDEMESKRIEQAVLRLVKEFKRSDSPDYKNGLQRAVYVLGDNRVVRLWYDSTKPAVRND